MLDAIEETAANPAWRNAYNFVQGQVEYSTNYPSASEEHTPPSTHIYNSGSGSGSGSGSAGVGPQAESSRAAYIIPGQPTHHIEDPQVITYPLPVAQTSHRSSTGRQDAPLSSRHGSSVHDQPVQAPQTYNTYPEQEYFQEQYPQEQFPMEQFPMEQYPQEQYPEEQYPEEQQAEQQDLEQQYVAPHRRRHSTRSSGGRRDSGRKSKGSGCCVVM